MMVLMRHLREWLQGPQALQFPRVVWSAPQETLSAIWPAANHTSQRSGTCISRPHAMLVSLYWGWICHVSK